MMNKSSLRLLIKVFCSVCVIFFVYGCELGGSNDPVDQGSLIVDSNAISRDAQRPGGPFTFADSFTFVAVAGTEYKLLLISDVQTSYSVIDPEASSIALNWSHKSGDKHPVFTTEHDGSYTINIGTIFYANFQYTIQLLTYIAYDDENDAENEAVSLVIDAPSHSASIGDFDDKDYFKFDVIKDTKYQMEFHPQVAADSVSQSQTQILYSLTNATKENFLNDDNLYFDKMDPPLLFLANDTGECLLEIDPKYRDAFPYEIMIKTYEAYDDNNDGCYEETVLNVDGNAVTARIGAFDDKDYYAFSAVKDLEYQCVVEIPEPHAMWVGVFYSPADENDENTVQYFYVYKNDTITWDSDNFKAHGLYHVKIYPDRNYSDEEFDYTIMIKKRN